MKLKINENIDLLKITNELNFEMFKHNNHICVVNRTSFGHYCGYVGVKKSSNCFGIKEYTSNWDTDIDGKAIDPTLVEEGINNISVHGGLTFSGDSLHFFKNIFGGEIWWFGFDTAHSGDARLYMIGHPFDDEVYRDFEYTKNEVISLSNQINEIEKIK